ncbi:hypothetical protein HK405_002440, partial [Cladochytrium tenue]
MVRPSAAAAAGATSYRRPSRAIAGAQPPLAHLLLLLRLLIPLVVAVALNPSRATAVAAAFPSESRPVDLSQYKKYEYEEGQEVNIGGVKAKVGKDISDGVFGGVYSATADPGGKDTKAVVKNQYGKPLDDRELVAAQK